MAQQLKKERTTSREDTTNETSVTIRKRDVSKVDTAEIDELLDEIDEVLSESDEFQEAVEEARRREEFREKLRSINFGKGTRSSESAETAMFVEEVSVITCTVRCSNCTCR